MDITKTQAPEDVFGSVAETGEAGRQVLGRRYRELAQQLHPDHGGSDAEFAQLTRLYRAAVEAMHAGLYGQRATLLDPVLIQTRRHAYKLVRQAARGAIANIYTGTFGEDDASVLVAVVRDPRDGPRLAHEATVLKELLSTKETFDLLSPYLPGYVEAFGYRRGRTTRQAIAYVLPDGMVSLRDVRNVYPDGVHPKDMAWIFRRLLMALGLVHSLDWTHGSLSLDHVLVQPEQHGLVLINWTRARKVTERATSEDIADAARCMDAIVDQTRVGPRLRAFINGCTLPDAKRRPHDALALTDEYDELIVSLWGPRTFRPFSMGAAQPRGAANG